MKDICCIGHITKDKIITPRKTVYMAGGTSFYFSYAFNHLPKDVTFQLVTKLGESEMESAEAMRRVGIDVLTFPSSHTVYFENKYGENQNERTQRVLERADPFTIEEMSTLDAKVFHLGSLLSDDFSPEVITYLSSKGRISIDAQGFLREVRGEQVFAIDWADKLQILAHTDIIKVNEHEMEVITGLTDPRKAAERLAEWGREGSGGDVGKLRLSDSRRRKVLRDSRLRTARHSGRHGMWRYIFSRLSLVSFTGQRI